MPKCPTFVSGLDRKHPLVANGPDGIANQRTFYGVPKYAQRPHVYAVAENAYQALLSSGKEDQTIVITGES